MTVLNSAVSQMNGCSCGPANTGPVMGWFFTVSCPESAPWALAVNVLLPVASSFTTPISAWSPDGRKSEVTSRPATSTRTVSAVMDAGTSTRIRASSPDTVPGRDDTAVTRSFPLS